MWPQLWPVAQSGARALPGSPKTARVGLPRSSEARDLLPRNKARSVVPALIILVSNIGGHKLRFIQWLANTTAIILTGDPLLARDKGCTIDF